MGETDEDGARLVKGRKPYEEEERRTTKRREATEDANRRIVKGREDEFKDDKRLKKVKEEDFKDDRRILKGREDDFKEDRRLKLKKEDDFEEEKRLKKKKEAMNDDKTRLLGSKKVSSMEKGEELNESEDLDDDAEIDLIDVKDGKRVKLWKRIPGFGLFLVFLTVLINSGMNIIIKEFTGIEPAVLLLYRSLIQLSFVMPWAVVIDKAPFPAGMKIKDKGLLFFRGILGFINVMATIYSVRYMNLGDQKMVTATKPIFVSISARLFLKERCGLFDLAAMFFMLVGIVFVVRPPILFGTDPGDGYEMMEMYSAIAVFVATALSANNTVILRKFRKEHAASLTSANQIFFIIESFIFIFAFSIPFTDPTWAEKLKLLILSVGMFICNLLLIIALKIEKANKVAVVNSSLGIIAAFLVQILYFGVLPNLYSILGTGLVSCSIVISAAKSFFTKPDIAKVS